MLRGSLPSLLAALVVGLAAPVDLRAAPTVRALAVPATGQPGFSAVDPVVSGVRFTNSLPPELVLQNQNLMNGSGVAAGDFDGDGWCDLYFPAINGTNALYRNLGNWRFEEVAAAAGVTCPGWHSTGAVFADVDGDGQLDLLVSTLGGGVHCFHNDGGGKFSEVTAEAGLTSKAGSMSLALADIDGDGDLDLYVANYGALAVLRLGGKADLKQVKGQWVVTGPYADRLRFVDGRVEEVGEADVLYLNDGAGHFQAVPWNSTFFVDEAGRPKAAPLDYGLGVQMRDVNGDGAPDIYVCNDYQTPDRLWLNDGHGHFQEASYRALRKFPFSSMGVDFADLDRDGRLDFMVVEMAGRDHGRQMRQVTGAKSFPHVPGAYPFRPQVPRNTLFHGNGDGSWSDLAEFAGVAATDWSWQPVFLDVDLDGYEDLLVASGMMFDTQDRDTLARIRALGKQTGTSMRSNLLLYPSFPSRMGAFRNRGDLTFEERAKDWGFTTEQIAQGVALADLDGDGDLDLVVNCLNGPALLLRNESPAPRVAIRLQGQGRNTRGIGAQLKVLGGPVTQTQEMIAGGRYLSGDDSIRTFAAGTAQKLSLEVTWRSGKRTVVPEARPNHQYEILEADAQPVPAPVEHQPRPLFREQTDLLGQVHHEEAFDDFARQPLLPKQLSSLGPGVAWCDLDGDGREELVIGTGRGGQLGGIRFGPAGKVTPLTSEWVAPDDVVGLAAWTTATGQPALLAAVANYEVARSNAPVLYQVTLRSGSTNLTMTPVSGVPAVGASPGPLAVADFDGDGDLDVFIGGRVLPAGYPRPVGSRLFRNDGGRLVEAAETRALFGQVGLVSGAVWSDLEGDGFPELILACEWGPVRIFRNDHGQLRVWDPPVFYSPAPGAAAVPLSDLTGWWTSVVTGDFDGDGRPDLVVGNWGLNTGYEADPAHPLHLYYGPLAGGPVTDLIEAYWPKELSSEVPRRSLNALAQAIPAFAERFPTHAAFGAATISDLWASLPMKPEAVSAATLTTLLLLNRGDHFQAVPLPAEAQFAPVFGLAVGDVDGDGCEDLFLAQNFFANRQEWPRPDAGRGLWLRGDGHGGFRPLSADESGVRIYGEQRGAALGDFNQDGRPDLVVTQNGAATTLWQNESGRPGLRLRLQGPRGNPNGHGAVVRLKFDDHLGPAREFPAGSGYLSQAGSVQCLAQPTVARAVDIRWPGGAHSVHVLPPGAKEFTAPQPPQIKAP